MSKKTYYVVARGRKPGVYRTWSGENGAAKQVQGFPGAVYKGFVRPEDALAWLHSLDEEVLLAEERAALAESLGNSVGSEQDPPLECAPNGEPVVIYTDGGAIDNPGPGGYGVVLRFGEYRRELSGGYRMTTNNRMELMACIVALDALKKPCSVVLYSDSRYVVDGIEEGWAERWRRHGWRRANGEVAENVDLWTRLLALRDKHDVDFRWVKGHAGRPENERADQLASEAARQEHLPPDSAFEADETQDIAPRLF
ncbi:MAG: ribonuclease HI [Anaerolineae bacterium]